MHKMYIVGIYFVVSFVPIKIFHLVDFIRNLFIFIFTNQYWKVRLSEFPLFVYDCVVFISAVFNIVFYCCEKSARWRKIINIWANKMFYCVTELCAMNVPGRIFIFTSICVFVTLFILYGLTFWGVSNLNKNMWSVTL